MEEEDEFEFDDNLYCVACDKRFKTTKAIKNHEKSKVHKANLLQLKLDMKEEESKEVADINGLSEGSMEDSFEEEAKKKKKKKKKKQQPVFMFNNDMDINDALTDDSDLLTGAFDKTTSETLNLSAMPESDDNPGDVVTNTDSSQKSPSVTTSPSLETVSNKNSSKKSKKNSKKKKEHSCVACNTNFPTRNKLFQHLKSTGHAKPISVK